MQATRLQLANKTLLNPDAPQWQRAQRSRFLLRGTEAHLQPSIYVRTAWSGRRIGAVRTLSVSAAHNRQNIFFRLEWPDDTQNENYADGSAFPDAAAVLFSAAAASAPLSRMGAPGRPLEGWRWRANHPDSGEALRYEGFATEQALPSPAVLNNGVWQDGCWRVVIGAPLDSAGPLVAFAVWEGSNQERAGLHSYAPAWEELEVL